MKIALAQINVTAGAVVRNAKKVLDYYARSVKEKVDLVIFPELCLSGYGAGDLLINESFLECIEEALIQLAERTLRNKCHMIIGAPIKQNGKVYNAALWIGEGVVLNVNIKHHLPNYREFNELRHFSQSELEPSLLMSARKIAVLICEDAWFDDIAANHVAAGAKLLIVINCSPFAVDKQHKRLEKMRDLVCQYSVPMIYLNRVGADDALIFDGGSFILDAAGKYIMEPQYWEEALYTCQYKDHECFLIADQQPQITYDGQHHIYQALMLSLKDYAAKNGFAKVLLGLSGGIDSALVAVIAADSLGSENVSCVALPSHISSKESFSDAERLSKNIGCSLECIAIREIYACIEQSLLHIFQGAAPGVAEENIQARIRGLVLMAISNKFGALLLATGNKSELAVGYCTLYGDMCGGWAPLKDIYKTQVYELAKWRNSNIPSHTKMTKLNVIPESIITKAPTAELRAGQKDEDSLPHYDILDRILYSLIELDFSAIQTAEVLKLDSRLVQEISKKLQLSEYKRQQGALGPKISQRDLSIQRRYPITNQF